LSYQLNVFSGEHAGGNSAETAIEMPFFVSRRKLSRVAVDAARETTNGCEEIN
jgi:hypothetical protein